MHRGLTQLKRAAGPCSELRRGPLAPPRRPQPRPGGPLEFPAARARPPLPRAPRRSHRLLGVDVDLKGLLLEGLQGDLHGAAAQLRCRACSGCWPLGGVCGLAGPRGRPRSACTREEGGGGGGFVTFALRSGLSPSGGLGPRRYLCDCGLSRELGPPCFLKRLAPVTEFAGGSRSSSRQAENPLAHHSLVAAIVVTHREAPPPPPERSGGWVPAGGARRRRLRRSCAARLCAGAAKNSAPELGRGDCGFGMSAAWIHCTQAQSLCLVGSWGSLGASAVRAFSRLPPPRLRPDSARCSNCAIRSRSWGTLRGDPTKWIPSFGAGELEGGRSGPGLSETIVVTT